ncbi:MAG: hypothetical protein ABIY51_15520 [Ferruginibacter sp.]
MKKIYVLIICTFIFLGAEAQNISKVKLSGSGEIESIAFDIGESVIVNISKEGSLLSWGVDNYLGSRTENYQDKYLEYTGKTSNYNETDNEAFKGRIKSIGATYITYYASFEDEMLRGKIKSIGRINFEYFPSFEYQPYKGYLKKIGDNQISWYGSYDNAAYAGKLKSLGLTSFTYYASYDDKLIRGKIKSIGGNNFSYYSSIDRPEYRGGFKTGNPVSFVNGIKYFITN